MVSRDNIFFLFLFSFCILPHLMVTFLYASAKFFNEFCLDPSLFMLSSYLFFTCTRHLQYTYLGPEHTLGECVRHWWISQIASSGQTRTRNSLWCRIHSINLTHTFMVTWHAHTHTHITRTDIKSYLESSQRDISGVSNTITFDNFVWNSSQHCVLTLFNHLN